MAGGDALAGYYAAIEQIDEARCGCRGVDGLRPGAELLLLACCRFC